MIAGRQANWPHNMDGAKVKGANERDRLKSGFIYLVYIPLSSSTGNPRLKTVTEPEISVSK